MYHSHSKAQATLFIIIAVVVLLLGGIGIYLLTRNGAAPGQISPEELAPKQAAQPTSPLQAYVEKCIQRASLQGLEVLRLQGGQIGEQVSPDEQLAVVDLDDGRSVVQTNGLPTVGLGSTPNQAKMWVNAKEANIPSLLVMAEEMNTYIKKSVETCVDEFKPLKQQGYNITAGEVQVTTALANAVIVQVYFPITATYQGQKYDLQDFTYQVPIDFAGVYTMAMGIAAYEAQYSFLEYNVLKAISLNSEVDKDSLPPIFASRFNVDCDRVTWNKQKVKSQLKDILAVNIGLLRVNGTNFTREISANPEFQGALDGMILNVYNDSVPHLVVNFSYRPSWNMKLDIRPKKGQTLEPEKFSGSLKILPLLCVWEYNFKYDVDHPVLVQITDTKSAKINPLSNTFEEGKGFTFQFPMEAVVVGNNPRVSIPYVEDLSGLDPQTRAAVESYQPPAQTFFCADGQSNSAKIVLNISDSLTKEPINKADIEYSCTRMANPCSVGQTDNGGLLLTRLPTCVNGLLKVRHEKYAPKEFALTTTSLVEGNIYHYELDGKKNVRVKFKKMLLPVFMKNYIETNNFTTVHLDQMDAAGRDALLGIKDLSPRDKVIIGGEQGDQSFNAFYPSLLMESTTISVGGGQYMVSTLITSNATLKDTYYGNTLINISANMTGPQPYPSGQYVFPWNARGEDVKQYRTVTFIIPAEWEAEHMKTGTLLDIDDPLAKEDGSLGAEVLRYTTGAVYELDGNENDDLRTLAGLNPQVYYMGDVVAPASEVQQYLAPRWN
ncbi:hypothetical protein HZB01_01590 [Candidatus Woesearchaeota archaeon]|nr:hypothetical protein [Candidatus Woesearchaeota archaeon]